ncbi:unnamed protein product [Sphagnum troendelagicum]|uniref:digalactosyldiacylglycerol synthase n=1 Tax=Sphagnum troendelagicum TaxID=128251 RepID=A0ABP0V050_9BRYO
MARRGGGGESAGVVAADAAPAVRAMSFISNSLSQVQRSAESDMELIRHRFQSLKQLSNSLDKEWGTRSASSSSSSSQPLKAAISSQDFDFLKNLKPNLSKFRRSWSDPDFLKPRDGGTGWDLSLGKSLMTSKGSETGLVDFFSRKDLGSTRKVAGERRFVVKQGVRRKKASRRQKLSVNEWEPLRRVKESVKDSLRDLESTAATSKTPSEFFENVQKTEFFENVKRNLDEFGQDVPPLDLPELLENLVRESEPLLDQLGFKKDVSEKVCGILRSCKRNFGQQSLTTTVNKIPDAGQDAEDLDLRLASVVRSTGYSHKGGIWSDHHESSRVSSEDHHRNIAIVTTASLPWMTGTAINPLFRAAYLAKLGKQNVTLLVPWLCKRDQEEVYPDHMTFETPAEQETFVRNWLEDRTGFKADFKIAFYPGKFSSVKRSILAAGDISQFIPDREADVAVLEEPEHLTWYYHGRRWTDKFQHVVGVVHTNYLEYVKQEKNGKLQAFLLEHVNNWMVRVYCSKVLRLSAATQVLPKSSVCNVHGVSPKFLAVGKRLASEGKEGKPVFSKGAYYLGKMIWAKGYRELVDLLVQNKDELEGLNLDVYGSGQDSHEVVSAAEKHGLAMNFHQGRDHADNSLHGYKVFINPSRSDVVCTTTAEALAMGKIVICADHPSNDFFRTFPNCLTYQTPEEFVEKVKLAMLSEPVPLSPELQHLLSWEAATERFIECAELEKLPPCGPRRIQTNKTTLPGETTKHTTVTSSPSMPMLSDVVDNGLAFTHYCLSGIEAVRWVLGAHPKTMHIDAQHCKDLGLPPRPIYGW